MVSLLIDKSLVLKVSKGIKKALQILLHAVGVIWDFTLIILILLLFAIKSVAFQTWLAQRAAAYLSGELNAEVRIDRIEIDFFDYATIHGLYISDQHKDTLIYVPEIGCTFKDFSLREEWLTISKAELMNPHIELTKYKGDTVWNYDFLEEFFSSDTPKKDTTSEPFDVMVEKIALTNAHFNYNNFNKPTQDFGVDFDHLCLRNLNAEISNFYQVKDTSFLKLERVWLHDCSGFVLDTLSADLKIHESLLEFGDLLIRTPTSTISTPKLVFAFSSFDDFDDFEDKVIMHANLNLSVVDLDDIAYFAPELYGINRTVLVKSKVRGTVNDLRLRKTELFLSEKTFVKGDFSLTGITDVENVFIDAQIDKFATTKDELAGINLPPFDGTEHIELPGRYARFGSIDGEGNFTGTPKDFVAYGEFNTDVGIIKTDIRFYIDTTDNYFHYKGDLITEGFRAGYFYDIADMGNVSMNIDVAATGLTIDDLAADLSGTIYSLSYMGYEYKNIHLRKGVLRADRFEGNVDVKDENIDFNFAGKVNFAKKSPEFNFNLTILETNLAKLHLSDRDSSGVISVNIVANAAGSTIDNFSGHLLLENLRYRELGKKYTIDSIALSAIQHPDSSKTLKLESPFADANFTGKYNFEELPTAFASIISKVLPSLFNNEPIKLKNDQQFKYSIALKNMDYISELFFPNLILSDNINLSGRFDSKQNIFRLKSDLIESIDYAGTKFNNIVLSAKNNGDYLQIAVDAKSIGLTDSISMERFEMDGELFQNRMATTITWANYDSLSGGTIAAEGVIHSSDSFEFNIKPSTLLLDGGTWVLNGNTHVAVSGNTVQIDDFDVHNGKQSIAVSGKISEVRNDRLNIDICSFDLRNLNSIINDSLIVLSGTLNGSGFVADVYNDIFFASNTTLDSLHLNGDYVGEFSLINLWDHNEKRVQTSGSLKRKEIENIVFSGYYYTKREKDNIDYILEMNQTNLSFLNAFIPSDISNLRGLATGKLTIKGSTDEPKVKGSVNFQNGAVKVNMLNTEYFFGGLVKINESMIAFDTIPLADIKGNLGWARGTFYHKNFAEWNFDCVVEFKKMLCLNTTEEMNPLYYGRAYASGSVNVFAYKNNVEIDVNVKTEKGTRIVMPLYGTSDVALQDFVRFVVADSLARKTEKLDLSGITMNFEFDVTPDAEVQIVFDKLAGDMMKGRGSGHLQLLIDPLGNFQMYGQYVVDQGDYLFTLMNVINKRFTVKKGSTISWYGDPLAADIDLRAIYKVQTTVMEIMPSDIADQYKRNSDVECEMILKDNLFTPTITFDIRVPRGDENVRAALAMIRASEQELSKQFFSLLAINKFMPLSNSISNANGSMLSAGSKATISELVSSQMSNWLSQISDEFDIGLNYKPGDEISSDEIAVALSTQLFNDRLILSTNVGVSKGSTTNQNPNQFIGDFNVEYKINEDGSFRVRGYNESNEFDITRTSQSNFTQGVGLYYTEEFDKVGDIKFIRKIKSWFKPKSKKKKEEEPAKTEGTGQSALKEEDFVWWIAFV